MITFRDPPPLQARIQPRAAVVPVDGGSFDAPWRGWLVGMISIAIIGVASLRTQRQQDSTERLASAFTNVYATQARRLALEQLPIGTPMEDVAKRLDAVNVTCRRLSPTAPVDSGLVCLGKPMVRANTYARVVMRFAARQQRLVAVVACPALVHWSDAAPPYRLVQQAASTDAGTCWRDPANVADNEWSYSAVPDRPFTVAIVHAADTVTRNAGPTSDTLIVRW